MGSSKTASKKSVKEAPVSEKRSLVRYNFTFGFLLLVDAPTLFKSDEQFPHRPRFQECCKRALNSAVGLAAWCSGYEDASLLNYYRQSVEVSWYDRENSDVIEDDGEEEEEQVELRTPP